MGGTLFLHKTYMGNYMEYTQLVYHMQVTSMGQLWGQHHQAEILSCIKHTSMSNYEGVGVQSCTRHIISPSFHADHDPGGGGGMGWLAIPLDL